MPSTLRSLVLLPLLLALSLAALPSCSKRSPSTAPVIPVVKLPVSCVTPDLQAALDHLEPLEQWIATCSSLGNSPEDCVTHDDEIVRALLDRMRANCGGPP